MPAVHHPPHDDRLFYPLATGREIYEDDMPGEIERRLLELALLPDDPQMPGADMTELQLCVALRRVLRKCHEVILDHEETSEDLYNSSLKTFNHARATLAYTLVCEITEQLDGLPKKVRKRLKKSIKRIKRREAELNAQSEQLPEVPGDPTRSPAAESAP